MTAPSLDSCIASIFEPGNPGNATDSGTITVPRFPMDVSLNEAASAGDVVTAGFGYVVAAAETATAGDSSDATVTAAPAGTTWNPADKQTITLSNGNLTATATTSNSGVRTILGLSAGKLYCEFTNNWTSGSSSVGLGKSTTLFSAVPNGQCSVLFGGAINLNGSNTGKSLGAGLVPTATIGMAVDIPNKLVWFRVAPTGNWNGSGTANPATGVGGQDISTLTSPLYCWMSLGANGDVVTGNFGASAFVGAVPSGYTAGWS
jgi:hypothetical protein